MTANHQSIFRGSWENLYRAMKDSEKLSKELSNGSKTVISFDLALYAKAIRLQVKPDIHDNHVFRIGELHVVFTPLKVLGKLIDGSELDQAFEEEGRTTVTLNYYSFKKWFQWFLKCKPSSLLPLEKLFTLQELHITHFL